MTYYSCLLSTKSVICHVFNIINVTWQIDANIDFLELLPLLCEMNEETWNGTHSSFYSCTCCRAVTLELAFIQPLSNLHMHSHIMQRRMKVIYNFKQTFFSGLYTVGWFAKKKKKKIHYIIYVRNNSTSHRYHSYMIGCSTKPVSFLSPLE